MPIADEFRSPIQLTEADLSAAGLVIVLDEAEHRPYMELRFPSWVDKVVYWHVGDLHVATMEEALALAEREVRALLERLAPCPPPESHSPIGQPGAGQGPDAPPRHRPPPTRKS